MDELIRKLEQATGPDRALDLEIQIAIGREYATHHDKPVAEWSTGEVPHYTRSIDDALTLVPEGWAFNRLNQYISAENPAWGWGAHLRPLHNPTIGYAVGESRATPALALSIAALKARTPTP